MNKRSIYHLVKRYPTGNISALLVGVLLLASCSFEHDGDSDGKTSAALSVTSVSISKPITRSVTAISSGSIGLFCTAYNAYKVQSNVQYTYSSSLWSAATATLLDLPIAEVCAYYPYGAANITSATDPTSVTLTSQKYSSAQDLSYDSVMVSAYNPKVNFVMNHAYSQITFSITRDVTYGGACAISGISIANAGIKTGTTLNMISGVYAAGTTGGTVSYNPSIASLSSGGSTTTSVLMVPVTTAMTGNMVITFTVDGVPVTANLDVASKGLTTLAAGTNYNIPITVKGAAISIGAVNVTDWSNEMTLDGGNLGKALVNLQMESNSYIVAPGATISFPVRRVTTAGVTTLTNNWTAGTLWGADILSGVPIVDPRGYITVTAGVTEGNAVVYIKDSSSNIIWSWHIWVTSYDPNTTNLPAGGYTWMDRNLGALSNYQGTASYGLFYEWGRKDPFTKSGAASLDSVTRTVLFSINNPGVYMKGSSDDTNILNAGTWSDSQKTVYDPCPIGWKVPPSGAWDSASTSEIGIWGFYFYDYGWYPCSGILLSPAAYGACWSSTQKDYQAYCFSLNYMGDGLGFASKNALSQYLGCNVRCIKQ